MVGIDCTSATVFGHRPRAEGRGSSYHLTENRFQLVLKNELNRRSLYVAAARMCPSSNSANASSRIVFQLSCSGASSGDSATSTYGLFGTGENRYISAL